MRLKTLLAALCLALLFMLTAGGILSADPFQSWRARVEDLRWHWEPLRQAAAPVVVVDIDDASLAKVGFWPWPRERIAQLAQILFERYGAAVVGLDVLYPEAAAKPAGDRMLGAAGRRYPLVFAQTFNVNGESHSVHAGQLPAGIACPSGIHLQRGQGVEAVAPSLGQLPYVGHISPKSDADGILRRALPLIAYQGRCYPSLSLAMLGALAGAPSGTLRFQALPPRPWSHVAWLAEPALGISLPLARDGTLTIPWRQQLPPLLPVHEVFSGKADASLLRNSIVLLGSSAAGLGDLVPTPLRNNLPGVMVHAVMIDALVDGRWKVRPDWADGAALLFTWALAALLLSRSITSTPWRSVLIALAASAGWLGINGWYWRQGLDLPLLPPLLCLLLQLPLQAAWQGFEAQRAQRRLFHQFSAYLPRDVLHHLIKTGADPRKLEAQRCEISVLFVDLVAFTKLAETLPPEAVAKLLNIVMDHLAHLVHDHGGTLDKFIGDALMAFWGAPLPQADHADQALACGQAMLAALPQINQALAAAGLPAVTVGIGINSGPAAVGNLGSRERRAYSAVGDTVNLAARLEVLTRELNEPLLLGEGACRHITHGAIVPLGRFALRGREQSYLVGKPA